MSREEDFELLEAWRAGDERAGRTLFSRHFDGVFRFFRNKVNDAAEDLTQQTFLGMVKAKERFRGDASFRTFLFSIARRRLYTYLRDRDRKGGAADFSERSVADLGLPSPTKAVAAREEHRLLLEALQRLPVDMQVALELHYWEGLTVNEIAEVTETPAGTVKRRLQRARAKLEQIIAELTEDDALRKSTTADFGRWAGEIRDRLSDKPDETS